MKTLKFTKAHEQILREQAIDVDYPGPVLQDFRTVLDFIGTQGVKAAGKYNLLPLDAIAELPVLPGQSMTLVGHYYLHDAIVRSMGFQGGDGEPAALAAGWRR